MNRPSLVEREAATMYQALLDLTNTLSYPKGIPAHLELESLKHVRDWLKEDKTRLKFRRRRVEILDRLITLLDDYLPKP